MKTSISTYEVRDTIRKLFEKGGKVEGNASLGFPTLSLIMFVFP